MQTHIEQTLNDIDGRIARLSDLKELIRLQLDDSGNQALAELRAKADPPPKPRKPYTRRVASASPARKTAKSSTTQRAAEINDAIRRLAEPFTPNQVRDAIGVANGSITCHRLENYGIIKRVGKGQYVRTAKFPGKLQADAASALAAAHPSTADSDPVDLDLAKEELADAIQRRDDARSRGQEKIAAVYQKRINELDARLNS
jgi:hypothetical protein